MLEIRLKERRESRVDLNHWRNLSSRSEFWRLVEMKHIRVMQHGVDGVILSGTSYVGRAIVGEYLVEVEPKVEGALRALLGFATASAFRLDTLYAPSSKAGELIALLAEQFVASAMAYASNGRYWEYRRQRFVSPLGGGRLSVHGTIALRSRGSPHLLAFEREAPTHDTDINRVVAAALRQVDNLRHLELLSSQTVETARGLAALFEDSAPAAVALGQASQFAEEAYRLLPQDRYGAQHDLLALSAVLLDGVSFETAATTGSAVPRTWFLNLETLFERAVLRLCAELLTTGESIDRGASEAPPMFQGTASYTANPDFVLSNEQGVWTVGDVKYKELGGGPAASDIYQLLCHAAAFGTSFGCLVFPGNATRLKDLGMSATGCRVLILEADVRDLRTALRDLLEAIRMAHTAAEFV